MVFICQHRGGATPRAQAGAGRAAGNYINKPTTLPHSKPVHTYGKTYLLKIYVQTPALILPVAPVGVIGFIMLCLARVEQYYQGGLSHKHACSSRDNSFHYITEQ